MVLTIRFFLIDSSITKIYVMDPSSAALYLRNYFIGVASIMVVLEQGFILL